VGKDINIAIATCIISIAFGSAVAIAVGAGMITQTNATYLLIGCGILFLVGVIFLIRGIVKPKEVLSYPINQQSNIKITNQSTHKLFHSIICEIVGAGLIVCGAYIVSQDSTMSMASFIGFLMVIFGFSVFVMGVSIGVSK